MAKNTIEQRLERIEQLLAIQGKQVLSIEECATLIGISKDRLRHILRERAIPHYHNPFGRVFFKRSEVLDWLTFERVPTHTELQEQALAYCASHPTPKRKTPRQ